MSQTTMPFQSCSLVAVNPTLAADRLGFDLGAFVAHFENVLGVHVACWHGVDLSAQDICNFASEVKQVQMLQEHGRVLLFGADLEIHITAIAIRFLAEGFETYLLKDLTSSSDNKFEAVHEMRLFSIGVIPTTMGQVLMEWIAFESDPDVKRRLTETLTLYRQLLIGTPR
jgi:hypothetical protein